MANEELIMHAREFTESPNLVKSMARELDNALIYIRDLVKIAEAFDKAVALSERRQTLLEEAMTERDAAIAAIERVRGVLSEWESRQERNREILGSGTLGHFQAIDCTGDLRAALDGAPEPEEKP